MEKSSLSAQQLIEKRILALHQRVAEVFARDSVTVRQIAKRNMDKWRDRGMQGSVYYRQWAEMMGWEDERIIQLITANSEYAIQARATSPFAGVLTARERWQILKQVGPI